MNNKVTSSAIGKAGEYRVASELILRGYTPYLPSIDNGVDIYLDNGKCIQVKSGHKHELGKLYKYNRYSFNFNSATLWKHRIKDERNEVVSRNPKRYAHPLIGIDVVILWAIEDDEFYIIPADKVRGKGRINFTADHDKRTQVKWNGWLPYLNNWGILNGEKVKERELLEHECKQCGHKWMPLKETITRCPKCHARWYLEKPKELNCNQCRHKWFNRNTPRLCPNCGSTLWNKPKRIPKVIDEAKIRELYMQGYPLAQIPPQVGLCFTTVWKIAKRLGITRSRGESLKLAWSRKKAQRLLT